MPVAVASERGGRNSESRRYATFGFGAEDGGLDPPAGGMTAVLQAPTVSGTGWKREAACAPLRRERGSIQPPGSTRAPPCAQAAGAGTGGVPRFRPCFRLRGRSTALPSRCHRGFAHPHAAAVEIVAIDAQAHPGVADDVLDAIGGIARGQGLEACASGSSHRRPSTASRDF